MVDFAAEVASQEGLLRAERAFRRNITAALTTALVALAVLASTALWLYSRERSHSAWVDHTYAAQARIANLATTVERMETARRGYMIAPRDSYWVTYVAGRARLPAAIEELGRFTDDNPVQVRNVDGLRGLAQAKAAQFRDSIELARAGDLAQARANFLAERDMGLTIKLRATLAAMAQEEDRLLVRRSEDERRAGAELLGVTLATVALLAAVGAGAVSLVRRYSAELQRAQGALRRLNAGLEEAVRDRTTDLTRANEEIQRFAYIVSHDLRSPLVNIMGFTSELEAAIPTLTRLLEKVEQVDPALAPREAREVVDQEMPEAIGFIRKSTQKMDRLINAILRLSREGRRNLAPESLDMTAVVEGIAATLRQLADGRGAQVHVEAPLPSLTADRVAVEQVFSNLVENALKYLQPGRPGKVVVRGRLAGGRLLYEVEDNGRGIDPKDHDRIFDLFRRSGAQDQPGEGIGLAHVRALVYRMGGVISCHSQLGQGATFRVSLPRQPTREKEAA